MSIRSAHKQHPACRAAGYKKTLPHMTAGAIGKLFAKAQAFTAFDHLGGPPRMRDD